MSGATNGKRPRLGENFLRFFKGEVAGGATLFLAALLALACANTPALTGHYAHWLHAPVGLVLGESTFAFSLSHFINDGLMAVFFLLVGLEIKRELLEGELSSRAQALLPAIAAGGGMALPAGIYVFFNYGDSLAMRGWAIPTATDIAFSLGVLALLGSRVPVSIKVFLTAVAVLDDLGAIAIIAVFYTEQINVGALALAVFMLFVLFLLNRNNIAARLPYALCFLVLWALVLKSGVHATLAGVAVAMAVPLRIGKGGGGDSRSPLVSLEHDLHHVVVFIILPVFAFANAGVNFSAVSLADLAQPIPLGIAAGLLLGKSVGITAAVWAATKTGVAPLPAGCSWPAMFGIACLCGIGFTVSLFIGNLAFGVDETTINLVKLGVLTGSTVAGVVGFCALRAALPKRAAAA